jgi:Glycosyl hydrolase catalytic core
MISIHGKQAGTVMLLLLVSVAAAVIGIRFHEKNKMRHSLDGSAAKTDETTTQTLSSHCSSRLDKQIPEPPPPLPGKKGIGMTLYPETWQLHLELIQMLNVSWNYSWDAKRITFQPDDIEFVPMVWGRFDILPQLERNIIPEFKAKRIHRFLTFNEPDNKKQANLAVEQVVDDYWPLLESANIPMSSPAAIHPSGNWSREFCKHVEANCLRMEYTALHWYGPANVTTFKRNLIAAYGLYGTRPILLTEFAVADWDAKTLEENRVRRKKDCLLASLLYKNSMELTHLHFHSLLVIT